MDSDSSDSDDGDLVTGVPILQVTSRVSFNCGNLHLHQHGVLIQLLFVAILQVLKTCRLASCLLASGSDDGPFSTRDPRMLKEGDSAVAHLEYHKHPVTSIEWSPREAWAGWLA
ncbi:hypothetical protein SAY86_013935 [Trapa natans]|uniref:Uncharacterized protein n=1 Tax=Trapa natans TaxID=22666 RepID=A0AAN7QQX8_TRANT|nr:hypothetical protein SAY86_013935 [Trapa natans]